MDFQQQAKDVSSKGKKAFGRAVGGGDLDDTAAEQKADEAITKGADQLRQGTLRAVDGASKMLDRLGRSLRENDNTPATVKDPQNKPPQT